ncbi:hypothetical protein MUG91_G127n12 [Manis pentadactyla]|nr:hypothetical protein MUG91_G127n12 [Manis pentadactyla]
MAFCAGAVRFSALSLTTRSFGPDIVYFFMLVSIIPGQNMQDDSLKENLRLAQEYQKLQTTFLTEKDHYFNLYNEQLSLGGSLRDKKQLCQLQERIHKVWQKHFRLVVLYSRMRLARFQTDSRESIQKILAVQEESSHLMQHIVDFFQTLTDGSCENDG